MAYQIPQQLQYKEKIMFGLTFKQLAYAFLFGFMAVVCLKKIHSSSIKFVLVTIFSLIGISFMFFNLEDYIRNYYRFLRSRKLEAGDSKLEKFIGIKEIKDKHLKWQRLTLKHQMKCPIEESMTQFMAGIKFPKIFIQSLIRLFFSD